MRKHTRRKYELTPLDVLDVDYTTPDGAAIVRAVADLLDVKPYAPKMKSHSRRCQALCFCAD